jgi:recombination protein RecA
MASLDDIIQSINKQYGKGTLLKANEAKSLVLSRLPTGIFDLDVKLGGGLPRGRITVFKGEFSTGKSAVAMKAAGQAQKHCRVCGKQFEYVDMLGEVHEVDCLCGAKEPMRVVWLDAEHSFDPEWAKKWGVDVENTYIIQTEYAEQAIDVADACIRSQQCDFLVTDSIAALTPSVEIEESSEKWQMGVMARLMNKALRKWTSAINSYGMDSDQACTILLINQLRMSLGGYRPTQTSPGGKGIDFFQSAEVRFKKNEYITTKGSDRPIGIDVEFVVKKNKTWPVLPGGAFKLYFVGTKGAYRIGDTNNDEQVLRSAAYWKLVDKGGSWYTFPDGQKAQGDVNAALILRENPSLLRDLEELVLERELSWAKDLNE